jgi:glutathione S-transferase
MNPGSFRSTLYRNIMAQDPRSCLIHLTTSYLYDAMGLTFFETGRGELKSEEWLARQLRKVNGVLKATDGFVKKSEGRFLVHNEFSVAGIAVGAILGMMNMVEMKFGLIQRTEQYPTLKEYCEMLEERESFKETQPYMFELSEKVA